MHKLLLRGLLALALLFGLVGSAHADGTLYLSTDTSLFRIDIIDDSTVDAVFLGEGGGDGLALSVLPETFLYNSLSQEDGGLLFETATDGSGAMMLSIINGDADRGLAYDTAQGILYGTDNLSFGTIDPATGAFSPLASLPDDREAEALAVDPFSGTVYGLTTGEPAYLMAFDGDSWSEIGQTGNVDGDKGGLAYDPTTDTLYAAETSGDLYRIDPATANDSFAGNTGVDTFVGLTFVPQGVPATPNWSLALLGVLVLTLAIWLLRRRVQGPQVAN